MPASRLGPLAAALLLGLLLLVLPPVRSDTETQKAGVCPELQGDLNCTEECVSDRDCADNLKCCRAGCVAVCVLPNGNPAATSAERAGGWEGAGRPGSGKRGAPGPRTRGRVEAMEPDSQSPPAPDPGRDKGVAEAQPKGRRPLHRLLSPWCVTGFRGKGLRRRAHLLASPLPTLFYSLFLSEKPGSCPQLSSGFLPLGFCHDLCQVDSQCPGQKKCCLNGCGNAYCATPHF
ncbi:WAP four-disulfide core domain protein 2 [Loxodonta africana]|uniref:WAP four-disulfide core domain protein 2 n=1 Tax=Loxodonta africana TaxID=9785 RepID=UPI0030CFC470